MNFLVLLFTSSERHSQTEVEEKGKKTNNQSLNLCLCSTESSSHGSFSVTGGDAASDLRFRFRRRVSRIGGSVKSTQSRRLAQ